MISQLTKERPSPPNGAKLYATCDPNNTIARRIEVYSHEGQAFIMKQRADGLWFTWVSDLGAARWVANNNGPRRKTPYSLVEGVE